MEVVLLTYEQIPVEITKSFQSVEEHHANYFWHYCAAEWHETRTHRVYVLTTKNKQKIYGFFALRVNNWMIKHQKLHIPILDVSFLDVAQELKTHKNSLETILNVFLEKIELIGETISRLAGCRYIRSYYPCFPDKNNFKLAGDPIIPEFQSIYSQKQFNVPSFKEKYKQRTIKNKSTGKAVIYLKYVIRDLYYHNR